MSPLVQITAVGALVKPSGSDRVRPFGRGDRVDVAQEDADRLLRLGTAELVDDAAAENAEDEQPDSGAIDLNAMTVPQLKRFADKRRIDLGGARVKSEMVHAIEEALTDPDDDEDGEG